MADNAATIPTKPDPASLGAVLCRNWWAFAIRGALGVLFGLFAFLMPGVTMLSLVILFAAYMLVDGVFAIIAAVRAARQNERWGLSDAGGRRQHRDRRHRLSLARPDRRRLRAPDRGLGPDHRCADAGRGLSPRRRLTAAGGWRWAASPRWPMARCCRGAADRRPRPDLVDRCLCHRLRHLAARPRLQAALAPGPRTAAARLGRDLKTMPALPSDLAATAQGEEAHARRSRGRGRREASKRASPPATRPPGRRRHGSAARTGRSPAGKRRESRRAEGVVARGATARPDRRRRRSGCSGR